MRKIIAIVLVMALVMSAFAICASAGYEPQGEIGNDLLEFFYYLPGKVILTVGYILISPIGLILALFGY